MANEIVDQLVDEWNDESNKDRVVAAAERLLKAGISAEEVSDILFEVIYAIRDEYGD